MVKKGNIVLLVVFILLLVFTYWEKTFFALGEVKAYFSSSDIDSLQVLSELVLNLATTTAIVFGGIWTYYKFVKGRTFKPKLTIGITVDTSAELAPLILIRFKIENTGNVRISPKSAIVSFSNGIINGGDVIYHSFGVPIDLVGKYYEENELFHIEPKDEMNVHVPLTVPENSDSLDLKLLCIDVEIMDYKKRVWKEQALIPID